MSEFSTNRFSFKAQETGSGPSRNADLCFDDGNIAILTGPRYFLVHEGLLRRHSPVISELLGDCSELELLEDRPVLILHHQPEEMAVFLHALYDGVSSFVHDCNNFWITSALLRLLTNYQVSHIRQDVLQRLSQTWPTTLTAWNIRERKVTNPAGVYAPRITLPHPILIINLAREIDAPELLPSAFYDLSRCQPSQAALGTCHPSEPDVLHRLSDSDLLDLLRGREASSRFLSTFIVNELEGREASEWCSNRNHQDLAVRRTCGLAFEAITFELLRDVNGVVVNRNSDPLYAIADAEMMQTRDEGENKVSFRACEACRVDFSAVADAAREEAWLKVPEWFGVDVLFWG